MARNEIAAALRAGEDWALEGLVAALQVSDRSIKDAAVLIGLAGASSLWRIAYDMPAVRAILQEHGRRRGGRHATKS